MRVQHGGDEDEDRWCHRFVVARAREREMMVRTEKMGEGSGFLGLVRREKILEERENKVRNEQACATCVHEAGFLFLDFFFFSPFLSILGWDEKWAGGSPNSFIFLIFS